MACNRPHGHFPLSEFRRLVRLSSVNRSRAGRTTMKYLTKEQQKVLCVILFLLLTGLAVKTWRTAHPPQPAATAPVR